MSTLVTTNLKHGGAASPNMVLTSGGDVTFGGDVTLGTSVLAAPTGDAPSYTCRAWVNFNGTGTVAIRASENVSSITDTGVGRYTVNFTTAMPDANYAPTATADFVGGNSPIVCASDYIYGSPPTTTTCNLFVRSNGGSDIDVSGCYVAVFR